MTLISAWQKDDALLADIRRSASETRGFRLWWLGQSGFLLQWQGKHVLFDPYLSDSLTAKYANTDKPHVRLSERVIDPARLDMIDIVTSSHHHTDHLDGETLQPLRRANPRLQCLIAEAHRTFVSERTQWVPDFPVGISDGQRVEMGGFTFEAVPAAHNAIERDEHGNGKYIGLVVSFGPYKIYHSGDTLWYEGMVEILRPFGVDVALLPINGNRPERRVVGNLNYEEAARLGKAIGARLTIPHHYHLFAFNTEDPQNFERAAHQLGIAYRVLAHGEGLSVGAKE